MAFEVYGANKSDTPSKGDVDFDAINQYVVKEAKLQRRETLTGVVSMLVDLGEQDQPDAEVTFVGTAEDELAEIAKNSNTYFKDGFDQDTKKPVRLKCWPQKPQQCIAIAVDFPDIIIDKGQFFGDSSPLPLRLWLGGQFYVPTKGMVIGRPTPLKYTNLDKTRATKVWSLAQNSLPYKMAVAAKLIEPGEAFLPERVDELLGKAFQFTAQVYMKPGKGGKEYYTEYVNFAAGLGRGQATPELPFEALLVQFNADNEADAVKNLRSHVVNTIKGANNYEGSKIKEQIEAVRGRKADSAEQAETKPAEVKPKAKPAKVAKAAPVVQEPDFDDDLPF
ncbi:hypothetical protein D3C85_903070 [compost metagenome]